MTYRIIALVGISGVGKTTFLKRIGENIDFQHLSAGSLIAQARSLGEDRRDVLRLEDIDDNQRLLLSGFQIMHDQSAPLVVLDGHAIIHTPIGIECIDSSVFREIGIDGMIHLSANPDDILRNRTKDSNRVRPQLGLFEIADQQNKSLEVTKLVVAALGIPLFVASYDDFDVAVEFMKAPRFPKVDIF